MASVEEQRLQRRIRRLRMIVMTLVLLLVLSATASGLGAWSRAGRPAQSSPEVGFARDMYSHHSQAVTMALMLRNRTGEPLNTITDEIATGQAEQQGIMLGWLTRNRVTAPDQTWRSMRWMEAAPGGTAHHTPPPGATEPATPRASGRWGSMPGLATDAELAALAGATGAAKDRLFLQLMLRHHAGGLDMAQAYLRLGGDTQLRALAAGIVTSQEREMTIMKDLLEDLDSP